jgi:hypothetical protein
MTYTPTNWWWVAADDRAYGSLKQLITTTADPDYVAWIGAGNAATIWPQDGSGNQTNAALQDVLTPYDLWVDLTAYAANARYNKASGGVIVTSLGGSVPFMTDTVSRNTINSAYDYMTQKGTGATVHWKLSDGTFIVLNTTQMTLLMNDVAPFVQSCFTCEANTVASITGGTITTQAQVDAAFAAISNVFP